MELPLYYCPQRRGTPTERINVVPTPWATLHALGLGAVHCGGEQYAPLHTVFIVTDKTRPSSTPPNHLRAIHILIAFLAAAVETKKQDDDNGSIGRNYCIGTAADGLYVAAGIVACNHIVVVDTSCTQ